MTKGNKRQPKSKNAPKRRAKKKKSARRQIVLPGQIVFLTARVSHRRYLLKPTRMTKEAFRYLLAHYATKWNIDIIAICVMSNHWHIMIRDNDGKRPKFLADLNRTLAQHIKTTYSTRGNIFRPKPNQVVCLHPEAIVDKIAYTLANPVSAGAVRYPEEWPGLRSRIADMGRTAWKGVRPDGTNEKPGFFGKRGVFGNRSTLPDTAELTLCFPEELIEYYGTRERAEHALEERLKYHVENAHAEMKRKGWKYLGAERAIKQDPFKQARSWEVFDALVPAFATRGLSHEERIKAKQRYKAWQAAYDECRRRFLAGEQGILWPAGTWAMVEHFGQKAEAPPS